MRLFAREFTSWTKIRARIISETGDYITECLRNPELGIEIPTVPAHKARWTPEFADAFWSWVL